MCISQQRWRFVNEDGLLINVVVLQVSRKYYFTVASCLNMEK